jgi:hypothetical protein
MKTQVAATSSGENTEELCSLQLSSKASSVQIMPVGLLSIELVACASQGSSKVTTAAFTFTPASAICKKGITATLVRTSRSVRSPSIARDIVSFNAVPWKCPIVVAVENKDLEEVQKLFSTKHASRNDRLPNGTSLLAVSQNFLRSYLYLPP